MMNALLIAVAITKDAGGAASYTNPLSWPAKLCLVTLVAQLQLVCGLVFPNPLRLGDSIGNPQGPAGPRTHCFQARWASATMAPWRPQQPAAFGKARHLQWSAALGEARQPERPLECSGWQH